MTSTPLSSPLSLQDNCKLVLALCIEIFPASLLARLSLTVRKQIFNVLPLLDRLHYLDSDLTEGIEEERLFADFSHDENNPSCDKGSEGYKKQLLVALFDHRMAKLINLLKDGGGCRLVLESDNGLSSLSTCDNESSLSAVTNYITLISNIYNADALYDDFIELPIIVPERLARFIKFDGPEVTMDICEFVSYCELDTCILPNLSIDLSSFTSSVIWTEYTELQRKELDNWPDILLNPVFPWLQDILQSVEHLTLFESSFSLYSSTDDKEDNCIDAPFLILQNIVTNTRPCLKSLRINVTHPAAGYLIDTVASFLCGDGHLIECTSHRQFRSEIDDSIRFRFLSSYTPYKMKELSIEVIHQIGIYATGKELVHVSKHIGKIIRYQKKSLTTFHFSGLYCPQNSCTSINHASGGPGYSAQDSFASSLETPLQELIQAPQFQSLEIGDPILKIDIVTEFLYMHVQSEKILKIMPDIEGDTHFNFKPKHKKLQDTNLQYKSLDLGKYSSPLAQNILSFPDLKLKGLTINLYDVLANNATDKVYIQHLSLNCTLSVTGTVNVEKLDRFISKNPALVSLSIIISSKQPSPFLPALNNCLYRLIEQGRNLHTVTLDKTDLTSFCEHEHSLLKKSNYSFLSTINCDLPAAITDIDLYVFFVLLSRMKATLTLINCLGIAENIKSDILVLKQSFKLNKIILKHCANNVFTNVFNGAAITVQTISN